MDTGIDAFLITWWAPFLAREFTSVKKNIKFYINEKFIEFLIKNDIHTCDCMGLSYCKFHCKVHVNVLVCILHMFPNKYGYNLIFVDKVHGIYQVDIGCPVLFTGH